VKIKKYPDRKSTYGVPYEGTEDLRPETKRMLESFLVGQPRK
jgi:hypothetical protein